MRALRSIPSAFGLALVYFAASGLSVAFTRYGGTSATLWIASGILIAALATNPVERWPLKLGLCAIAATISTGLWGMGWAVAFPLCLFKMGEAVVGAMLFKRFDTRRTGTFSTIPWLLRFFVSMGLVAPIISATGLALAAGAMALPAFAIFKSAYLANALGNLTVIPLALPFASAAERAASLANVRRLGGRFALAATSIAATALLVFSSVQMEWLVLPFVPLVISTMVLGREIAVVGTMIVAAIGVVCTAMGLGPMAFANAGPTAAMLAMQAYLSVTVFVLLPVALELHAKQWLMEQLRSSEERFRLLAEQSSDIIALLDPQGRIDYISPAVERMCGLRPDALVGRFPTEMIVSEDHDIVIAANRAMMDLPDINHVFQWRGLLRSGAHNWFETNGRALMASDGTTRGTLSIIRDVSERKSLETALTLAALTDPLTGLSNRRAFRTSAERMLTAPSAEGHCLAMFDIDHFKRINDRHGHDGGDALLCHFAKVTRGALRDRDLLARLGGEEFGLLLPATSVTQAMLVCERLRRLLAETPLVWKGASVALTVSGGLVALDERGIDFAMSMADKALYEAKAGGRNQLALAA